MHLELVGLSQQYQDLPVIQDISLALGPGDHLALLGPSGCGKSTLFRILTGLDRPTAGQVRFNGQDITGQTGHFGFMSQQDLLLPWNKLWENIGIPLKLKGLRPAQVRQQVQAGLNLVGLENFADYYPHQLSGGMRQRAAFLRTYLTNKELLLLDEPFAALDAITRSRLQIWLGQMLEQDQATLFLVTHSVEEALLLASRVIVLTEAPGRILLDLALPFSDAPTADKAFLPAFLETKRLILEALGQRPPTEDLRPG